MWRTQNAHLCLSKHTAKANLIGCHYESIQPMWLNLTQFKFNISGIFSRNKSVQREIKSSSDRAFGEQQATAQTEQEPLFLLKGHFYMQLLV